MARFRLIKSNKSKTKLFCKLFIGKTGFFCEKNRLKTVIFKTTRFQTLCLYLCGLRSGVVVNMHLSLIEIIFGEIEQELDL